MITIPCTLSIHPSSMDLCSEADGIFGAVALWALYVAFGAKDEVGAAA